MSAEPWFVPESVIRIVGRKGVFRLIDVHSYIAECGEVHWGTACPIPHGSHLTVKQEDTYEFRTI